MSVLKTTAIKNLLMAQSPADLATLYSIGMEVQVNVAQDGGTRVDGEFKGRQWHGWTDGITTWKTFRIPHKAKTDPEYTDAEIGFDLAEHAEGIGMTGWNWSQRKSMWVAFDFDAIVGHSDHHTAKMSNEELEAVQKAAFDIPWVTIRKSTGGKGLHIYVFTPEVETKNHNEHAALARAILGKMSAITGFDFNSKVDNCGHIMWVWHRKMFNSDGLKVIKKGRSMLEEEVPLNWKDHVDVVSGTRRKTRPHSELSDAFDELCGQRPIVELDEDHKKLIKFLEDNNLYWTWDSDNHLLITHTHHLKTAHSELMLKGVFETLSSGSSEKNVFCFALRKGAWAIRRFTPGVQEHASWIQDGAGWTRCYFNREPDLKTVCRGAGALEDTKFGFNFREVEVAASTLKVLGVHMKYDPLVASRPCRVSESKDGRIVVEIEMDKHGRNENMGEWICKKDKWVKIFNAIASPVEESETGNYDDVLRHVVTETDEDYGWVIKSDGSWRFEPLQHVKVALQSMGFDSVRIAEILGMGVFKPWRAVCKPFEPEYPGDRQWNRKAAQLRYAPTKDVENLSYPTWRRVLAHCGKGLDDAVKTNPWCKANGILTGGEYLMCWIASMFQEPTQPLPYLFLYGPQNSGKSILHEALSLLLTIGYRRADSALISQSGFNAELEGAILCVIEETELRKDKVSYNRIKDWVTSRELAIHAKGKTPYHTPNYTHWIQVSNDKTACPIAFGDTRITMIYVGLLDPLDQIPKKLLLPMLQKEAPDFLAALLSIALPPSNDRLNIPVVATDEKNFIEQISMSPMEKFMAENIQYVDGNMIKFSDFYDRFALFLDPDELRVWNKIKMGRELPPQVAKGRSRTHNAQMFLGNIAWKDEDVKPTRRLILDRDGFLTVQ